MRKYEGMNEEKQKRWRGECGKERKSGGGGWGVRKEGGRPKYINRYGGREGGGGIKILAEPDSTPYFKDSFEAIQAIKC